MFNGEWTASGVCFVRSLTGCHLATSVAPKVAPCHHEDLAQLENPHAPFEGGLYDAICRGDERKVRLLLERGERCAEGTGVTGLHHAAVTWHVGVVQALLEHGADVLAIDSDDWPPLFWAAASGNVDVMQLLVDAGADINITSVTDKGYSALHAAAQGMPGNNAVDAVRWLLDRGADINVRAVARVRLCDITVPMTPLHVSAQSTFPGVVQLLLDRGATTDACGGGGMNPTPLHSALPLRSFRSSTQLLSSDDGPLLRVVRALLDAGANPAA